MYAPITVVTTVVLSILFLFLSARTIITRGSRNVSLGHGDDPEMLRVMRAHANFAEYVPLALFILYLCETLELNHIVLLLIALCLVVGRCIHAYAFSIERIPLSLRVAGAALTFISIILGILTLSVAYLSNF